VQQTYATILAHLSDKSQYGGKAIVRVRLHRAALQCGSIKDTNKNCVKLSAKDEKYTKTPHASAHLL
jgi:hypothetical protein